MSDVRTLPTLIDRLGQAETRRDDLKTRLVDLEDAMDRERERFRNGWITRDEFFDRMEIAEEQWRVVNPAYKHAREEAADLLGDINRMLS
jgi:hypothetical protein